MAGINWHKQAKKSQNWRGGQCKLLKTSSEVDARMIFDCKTVHSEGKVSLSEVLQQLSDKI